MAYPGAYALKISQGETVNRTFTWSLAAGPVDLTGYTARAQVRARMSSPEPVLDLTSAPDGGITLGGPAGTITVRIDAATTAGLPAVVHVWSLELTSPNGGVTPLLSGAFEIRAEVTR